MFYRMIGGPLFGFTIGSLMHTITNSLRFHTSIAYNCPGFSGIRKLYQCFLFAASPLVTKNFLKLFFKAVKKIIHQLRKGLIFVVTQEFCFCNFIKIHYK